ncbi:MAG: hypothetical protein COB94_007330 [Gammaproteobacteria bacterium]|nr:hypothetical protein [Gammaproteobacteria bacterium]
MSIDSSDTAIIDFYKKVVELGLSLLTHAGMEKSFSSAHDEPTEAEKLILLLASVWQLLLNISQQLVNLKAKISFNGY